MTQIRKHLKWTLVPIALILFSCVTTGPGGRKSLIILPESQEVALGKSVAEQVDSTETLYANEAWQAYITEVGNKIAAVSDRPNLDWQFKVIESDQINAFAAPGGFVYFYTGILNMMDSESELAAVMAHEISHVVGRHSVKHLQTALGASVLAQIALGEEAEGTAGQVAGIVIGLSLTGYGRGHEFEADAFGVHYMTKAGYNPRGATAMFTKLAQLSGGGDRGFFENLTSTHPDTKDRISRIETQIAEMPQSARELPHYRDRYQLLKKQLPPPAPQSGG
ncbi:MAG TPA: M48 family metallopeptidase [Acidobacteriota bacterium]|nr:M48 family metallopeptidase [Acidobacteriota bacterium]